MKHCFHSYKSKFWRGEKTGVDEHYCCWCGEVFKRKWTIKRMPTGEPPCGPQKKLPQQTHIDVTVWEDLGECKERS